MTTTTEWADFFNGFASKYETYDFTKNTIAEVEFLVAELGLLPGQSILDVGCGTGRHSIELAKRGFAVTGLDVSAGMLAEAKRKAAAAKVDITWVEADATAFTFDRGFDAVICLCEGAFGLLGSADDPIQQPLAILRNVAAVMNDAAKCLFTVLNGYAMIRRHQLADVEADKFQPMALTERSDAEIVGTDVLRERGFVPTELVLLFTMGGLEVQSIWGGTAGNWGKRDVDLDEMEIMILASKTRGFRQ
jgi:cyclopropane fatty-acyl-phospholipid synthase-like methyltransferase